jgi:hypothetical protein
MPPAPSTYCVLLDAPGEPVKRIPIARLGSYSDKRYGSFKISDENFANWDRNLGRLPGAKVLVDVDHRADRSPRDTSAAGWVTSLERDGDIIFGRFEPTPLGEKLIREKRYAFTSAVFGPHVDEHGQTTPDTLVGISLTNKPFITSMPAICLMSEENLALAQLAAPTIADVDLREAIRKGEALRDGSFLIRDPAELKAAIKLVQGGHGGPAAKAHIIKRALQLKRVGDLPADLKGAGDPQMTKPQPATSVKRWPEVKLDAPIAELLDPSARERLDVVVRTLARQLDLSYPDSLDRLRRGADSQSRLDGALVRCGVKPTLLDSFQDNLRALEGRDAAVMTVLDQEMERLPETQLDAQGRLVLDRDFDVAQLLHDDEERERRWRRARDLDPRYVDRLAFDREDVMYLEAGRDLVGGLERPVRLAEALRTAENAGRQLDAALASADSSAARQRLLEGVLPDSAEAVDEQDKASVTRLLSSLSSDQLSTTLDLYLHDGRTLESAAAEAREVHPDRPRPAPEQDGESDGRSELDDQVRSYALEHTGGDYVRALEQMTGASLD